MLELYQCRSEASLAKYGTLSATSSTAMWCALPPPPLPPKRQWKPCVVLRKKKKESRSKITKCAISQNSWSAFWNWYEAYGNQGQSLNQALRQLCQTCTFMTGISWKNFVCWRYLKTMSRKRTCTGNAQKTPSPSKQQKTPTKNSQLKRCSPKKTKPLTPSSPVRIFNLYFSRFKVRNCWSSVREKGLSRSPGSYKNCFLQTPVQIRIRW